MASTPPDLDLLRRTRAAWMRTQLSPEARSRCLRNGIEVPGAPEQGDARADDWASWQWHNARRLRYAEDLVALFPEYAGREVALDAYLERYELSILPLNLLLPEGVRKFLPRLGLEPPEDPYGVQRADSVVVGEHQDRTWYLATRKPDYATFLVIMGGGAGRIYCPIGCAGCYRGHQTRFGQPLRVRHDDGRVEDVHFPPPTSQIAWLVEAWNAQEVFADAYDLLLSGGEPMMLSNRLWAEILVHLRCARHLRCLRICTGALFLGLPTRFDDAFLSLLEAFRRDTGVATKMAVHVAHPDQVTAEAVHAALRLQAAGVELQPQIPLEPGVNVWLEDLDRSERTLRELARRLAMGAGARPYKWLLDLLGGVPLLPALELWRRIHDRHQGESDLTKPTSFALTLPRAEGNVNLSYHSLWAIEASIDRGAGRVRYRLPHPSGVRVDYEEPLLPGVNDDPSLLRPA